jgi:Fe-S-cluster containining protein
VDCTSCANYCRYSVVSVNRSQISRIAEYLGTTADEVARLYTVPDPDAPALRILRRSSEGCVFLEGNLCMIYQARPKTCRDFPHVAVGAHSLGSRQSSLAHCQVGWNLGCGPCDWRARIEFTNTKQYCGRSALPRALAFRGGKTVSGRRLEALT